jgi:hypothetical protein
MKYHISISHRSLPWAFQLLNVPSQWSQSDMLAVNKQLNVKKSNVNFCLSEAGHSKVGFLAYAHTRNSEQRNSQQERHEQETFWRFSIPDNHAHISPDLLHSYSFAPTEKLVWDPDLRMQQLTSSSIQGPHAHTIWQGNIHRTLTRPKKKWIYKINRMN